MYLIKNKKDIIVYLMVFFLTLMVVILIFCVFSLKGKTENYQQNTLNRENETVAVQNSIKKISEEKSDELNELEKLKNEKGSLNDKIIELSKENSELSEKYSFIESKLNETD